jgi:hypothetical protein
MKTTFHLKFIISVLLLQISFQNLSFSQEQYPKFHFGVFAGVNVSKVIPLNLGINFTDISKLDAYSYTKRTYPFGNDYQWTTSYNLGISVDFNISKSIYFGSGLTLISKNAISSPTDFTKVNSNSYKGGIFTPYEKLYQITSDYESNAIQIPVSLHFVLYQKNNFKSNINFGIIWENMFHHKKIVNFITSWKSNNTPPDDIIIDVTKVEKYYNIFLIDERDNDIFTKNNVGYFTGLGFSVKKIGIDFSYNISDRTYGSVQYQVPSFMANLRYQIK